MEYKRYVKRNIHYLDFPDHEDQEVFMIVFDVSDLEEEELNIEFLEGNKLKVSFKHGFRDSENLSFSRDCTYVYALPKIMQFTDLVAYWSGDNFLVIKEKKRVSIKGDVNSKEDSDGRKPKFEESLNSSATLDNEQQKKIFVKSSDEEIAISDLISKTLASEQEILNQDLIKLGTESEGPARQEKMNVSNEMELQENQSQIISSNENMIEKIKLSSTSSKIREMKSGNKPKHFEMHLQKNELMDASNIMQQEFRLIPKRMPNLLYHMISESDLQAAMNDIEKRMKFVNDFIDKNRMESTD